MSKTITRAYAHKTHGTIGDVEFTYPNGSFKLNGEELPESSVTHLMTFALQSLQDAYAGAKNNDEAVGAFNTKLDRLLKGEIGVRGTGVDSFTKMCQSVAREILRANMKAQGVPYKTFTEKSAEDQADIVDKIVNKHRKVIEDRAKQRIAEQEARNKELAGIDIGKVEL